MINVAVLTISDAVSRGAREDTSGRMIERVIGKLPSAIVDRAVVPDERPMIAARIREWCDGERVDLVLSTGGTGLSPRDVTPEATRDVIEREVPGLPEAMRLQTSDKNVHAILSRGIAGIRGRTLIVNLPGSPKGVEEMLEAILPVLPHAIEIMKGFQADHTPPAHVATKSGEGHSHGGHHEHGHHHDR